MGSAERGAERPDHAGSLCALPWPCPAMLGMNLFLPFHSITLHCLSAFSLGVPGRACCGQSSLAAAGAREREQPPPRAARARETAKQARSRAVDADRKRDRDHSSHRTARGPSRRLVLQTPDKGCTAGRGGALRRLSPPSILSTFLRPPFFDTSRSHSAALPRRSGEKGPRRKQSGALSCLRVPAGPSALN